MIAPTLRRGFTLVELLVSLALAIVVLGLAVAVSQSSLVESYKVVGAADKVAQALISAKSRAAREKAPRGIRFIIDPTTNLCVECVTIEQPDAWTPNTGTDPANKESLVVDFNYFHNTAASTYPPTPGYYGFKRVWVANGTLGDFDYYPQANRPTSLPSPKVRVGDSVTIPGMGQTFRIAQITVVGAATRPDYPPTSNPLPAAVLPATPAQDPASPSPVDGASARASFQLFLADPVASPGAEGTTSAQPTGYMLQQVISLPDFGAATGTTTTGPPSQRYAAYRADSSAFGVVRQAQPLVGEQTLQLASGMAIDFNVSGTTEMLKRAAATDDTRAFLQPPAVAAPQTFYDILFGPSGEVMGTTSGQTIFLLRDVGKARSPADRAYIRSATNTTDTNLSLTIPSEAELLGQQVLVCVFNRTGATATRPVNQDGGSPYKFALDGISSGL